ncbi:MAG: hypothetical protein ACXAB9_14085 [Candidatus Thorarchaeota archaeon]
MIVMTTIPAIRGIIKSMAPVGCVVLRVYDPEAMIAVFPQMSVAATS